MNPIQKNLQKSKEEEVFDPKKEIEKLCEENKIFFTGNGTTHEDLIAVGLGNLLYNQLTYFVNNEKVKGFHILKVRNPETKQEYYVEIKCENENFKSEEVKKQEISSESLEILKNPKLFDNLIKELDKRIEGEEKSKKAILLSLCSVWVNGSEVPLNTLVSSESSAGKSFVCKNIIKLFPKNMVVYRTKITPEAFTYWKNGEDWSWDGKICYLEDVSQGILDSPTFKVMCSEGSTATIVIKQKAVDIDINGKPVMLVTTARTDPNTEILNRFQIISLDESKEQTRKIIFKQAKQDNLKNYDEKIIDSLKILRRKSVHIPYAEKIAEQINQKYNFENIRLRRDFPRLLELIRNSACLYQFQREVNENNEIIANEQDYAIARECINYIQTQTFKGLTHKLKKAFDCCNQLGEFTAKEIHSKFPFCSQKMWYNYLDELAERSMLTSELRKTEESKSRVTFYKVTLGENFELPEFDKLPQNITNLTIVSNNSINSNLTIVQKDCNDCNDLLGNPVFNDLKLKKKAQENNWEDSLFK